MNEATSQPTLLIAVYARVSTARQEEEGTIETQLSAIRDFAAKNNYTIIKDYVDNGWSGDMLARPALDQLREDAKKKLWQAVLIYDPDRLARRYSFQELVMDELREIGIEPLFVTVSPSRNHEDRLMYGVRGIFDEYARTKIAERFRLGKIQKAKEGHVLTTEAPYGYSYIPKRDGKHGYYEINEYEAEVVRRIFSLVADDRLSIRMLVQALQEMGASPQKSKRKAWSTSTLSTLLRNKTYIGEGHFGASYAVVPERPLKTDLYKKIRKTSRRMRPESEWIIIPTPGIVDRDLFLRAQQRLKDNFVMARRNRKNEYLLSGKIRCICGRTRAGEGPQRGKHLYYRCSDRVLSYPLPPTCRERGINARIADELVWEKVAQLMRSKELLLKQVERWATRRRVGSQGSAVDLNVMQKEAAKLRKQEDRYAKAYAEGLFSIAKLQAYITPVREKIASVEGQIAKARAARDELPLNDTPLDPHEIEALTVRAARALQDLNFEAKRAIVMNVIDKVVATQEVLEVHGFIPITDHVEFQTSNRDAANTTRHGRDNRSGKSVPFELVIPLPPPLRRGIDYGFLPGANVSKKGRGTRAGT
jgi:site-specific DNA recombinase